MRTLPAPPASSDVDYLADWIEVCALTDVDGRCSLEDLVSALRTAGSVDGVEEVHDPFDSGSEETQILADSAFQLISTRSERVSPRSMYPFNIIGGRVERTIAADDSVYSFMVLSSYLGGNIGSSLASYTRLFEDVSAIAARGYMGGDSTGAVLYQMGSPRRAGQAPGFRDAVAEMIQHMADGGAVYDRPNVHEQKDGKLDIAVWLPLPDRRSGKIIGFGQCATGNNWHDKLSELQPDRWCRAWLTDPPAVSPVQMFFVPHAISDDRWELDSVNGGILFDRFRIASFCSSLSADMADAVRSWNHTALSGYREVVA